MALGLAAACSSTDDGGGAMDLRTWRCFTNPTAEGIYCECRLATDGELEAEGLDPDSFAAEVCPSSNYKCCEAYSRAEAYDGIQSCICWNPETVPFCNGKVPIVSHCP